MTLLRSDWLHYNTTVPFLPLSILTVAIKLSIDTPLLRMISSISALIPKATTSVESPMSLERILVKIFVVNNIVTQFAGYFPGTFELCLECFQVLLIFGMY